MVLKSKIPLPLICSLNLMAMVFYGNFASKR